MKATVTIDLPVPPKGMEWYQEPIANLAHPVTPGDIHTEQWTLRRIATEYVNVRLRRGVAEHFQDCFTHGGHCGGGELDSCQLADACREALSERNEPYPFWRHERDHSKWCNPPHDFDWRCTLPAAHAGPHGV